MPLPTCVYGGVCGRVVCVCGRAHGPNFELTILICDRHAVRCEGCNQFWFCSARCRRAYWRSVHRFTECAFWSRALRHQPRPDHATTDTDTAADCPALGFTKLQATLARLLVHVIALKLREHHGLDSAGAAARGVESVSSSVRVEFADFAALVANEEAIRENDPKLHRKFASVASYVSAGFRSLQKEQQNTAAIPDPDLGQSTWWEHVPSSEEMVQWLCKIQVRSHARHTHTHMLLTVCLCSATRSR